MAMEMGCSAHDSGRCVSGAGSYRDFFLQVSLRRGFWTPIWRHWQCLFCVLLFAPACAFVEVSSRFIAVLGFRGNHFVIAYLMGSFSSMWTGLQIGFGGRTRLVCFIVSRLNCGGDLSFLSRCCVLQGAVSVNASSMCGPGASAYGC